MNLLSSFPSQSSFLRYCIASNWIEIVDDGGFNASVFCARVSKGTKEGGEWWKRF